MLDTHKVMAELNLYIQNMKVDSNFIQTGQEARIVNDHQPLKALAEHSTKAMKECKKGPNATYATNMDTHQYFIGTGMMMTMSNTQKLNTQETMQEDCSKLSNQRQTSVMC
ncbi:uncharacterized protein DS421_4g125750 [Arachis hypogaea]|nr:uncharacterized protein DS421_4g125750 [Arachis hypogaea]